MSKPMGQIIREETTTYIVPAGTGVHVCDKTATLISHQTVYENRFGPPLRQDPGEFGPTFTMEFVHDQSLTIVDLLDKGHYVFDTGNPDWPYMVVPKSVFQSNVLVKRNPDGSSTKLPRIVPGSVIPGSSFKGRTGPKPKRFTKKEIQKRLAEQPEEAFKSCQFGGRNREDVENAIDDVTIVKKLTKRQGKKMSKTHKCPDCDGNLKGGAVGPWASQSVHCPACGSKFFASAYGVERR